MEKLQLEQVTYRYKKSDKDVLKEIFLEFTRGKVYAIVGPSGSGKSTLLSILAGLDKPTSGKVLLDDTNLAQIDLDKYRREQISMIFQAFHLFPFLTAMENVCYPMEQNGISQKEAKVAAEKLLSGVQLDIEHGKRHPSNLSGGEQQRVAIARALSSGAKFLLADEPTGNLDEENGERVSEILKTLAHEENYCVILVTHDLDIAAKADVIYRLRDGRVVESSETGGL